MNPHSVHCLLVHPPYHTLSIKMSLLPTTIYILQVGGFVSSALVINNITTSVTSPVQYYVFG